MQKENNPFQKLYDPEYIEEKNNLDRYREQKEKEIKMDTDHYYDWIANLDENENKNTRPVVLPSGCTIEAVPGTEHNEKRLNILFPDK